MAIARDQLRYGRAVVADSVNPIAFTREAWRACATHSGSQWLEIEVRCSDPAEHRQRLEQCVVDVEGLHRVAWEAAVLERTFEPWTPNIRLDTAGRSVQQSTAELLAAIERSD
ncbi:MAG: hypothetical protein KTR31_13305 [Myxococcales bacterium]|nr:hypothetical protein [Myxococcales bacterium]